MMSDGYTTVKLKSDASEDKQLIKSVKFYCQGRGCRHSGEPELRPTAVCFYIGGYIFTHREVYDRISDLLPLCPGARIKDIQYVPLAVHLDTLGTENRWIITLNSVAARNQIAGSTLHIKGRKVTLRRYDDIIQLEFRKCSRSNAIQQMVNRINNLDGADL